MKKKVKKILIVNSGRGGNLKKIYLLLKKKNFKTHAFIYNSDTLFRFCLKNNIEAFHVKKTSRKNLDKFLFNYAGLIKPNVIILFFDYIINKNFIKRFNNIFNLHYTLLPKFKGIHGLKKSLNSKNKELGCTFHVVNEKIDQGKIVLQSKFKNLSRYSRIQKKEKLFNLGIKILKIFISNIDYFLTNIKKSYNSKS
jgi:phosphoribosylglycinamide formyltransferase-1